MIYHFWIGPFGPTSKFNAFLVCRFIIFCLTWDPDRKRSVSNIIICHEDIIWWCVLWTPRSSRGLGQVGQLALDLVGGALGGQHFTSMKVVSWRSISRIQDDPGTNKIESDESWTYSGYHWTLLWILVAHSPHRCRLCKYCVFFSNARKHERKKHEHKRAYSPHWYVCHLSYQIAHSTCNFHQFNTMWSTTLLSFGRIIHPAVYIRWSKIGQSCSFDT